MPAPDAPNVVMVPVQRYDVNFSLSDILTPLTQVGTRSLQGSPTKARDLELQNHLKELSDLAAKLKEVVDRIQAIDPTFLAPAPRSTPQR